MSTILQGPVAMDVAFATFFDENLPPSNLANHRLQKTCALTTGGFPHELVLTTVAASAKMNRIVLRFSDVKHITLDRRNDDGTYQSLDERVLEKEGDGIQEVEVLLDPEGVGKDIHELRLRLLAGHSEFVGIYRVDVFGEESQQKFAVFEKKPDISM